MYFASSIPNIPDKPKPKKFKTKIRQPQQIAGGGLNRSGGLFKSDRDYTRKNNGRVDFCPMCREAFEDCGC